jgi:hypothetical protein
MSAKSFFSDQECRDVGFSEPMIRTLRQLADFVDTVNRVTETEGAVATVQDSVDAISEEQEDQNLSLSSLDTRLDTIENLEPFVRQDQTAAWTSPSASVSRGALPAYAAPTISAAYTQAEVQAIATQLAAVTSAVAGLISDLRANGALT